MSHGRRRFVEAARAGDLLALEGLRLVAPLFEIERLSRLAGDTAEERLARRIEHSKPVVDKLRAWLDEHRVLIPPKTRSGVRSVTFIDNGCASPSFSRMATSSSPTIAVSGSFED
jgi:hypothetical protein